MRRKLLLSFLLVVVVGILITGLYSLKMARDFYMSSLENKLESDCRILSELFLKEYVPGKTDYDTLAKYYSGITQTRVTIIMPNGLVIGESSRESMGMENHLERPEIKDALSGKTGQSLRHSATEGYDMLYVAYPVKMDNSITEVIRLSVPLTEIESMESRYIIYIIIAIAAGIFGSFIIALFLMRGIVKPVREMTMVSSQIAGGSYDKRIRLHSSDEIGDLAQTFNNMAEKLETTISDLSDKSNKLEAILKSMQSGVAAVDGIGRIMLVNPAALNMFGINENIIGRHILEVFRNIELEDIILNHQDETREIKLNYPDRRILRIKATPILDSQKGRSIGNVVVMQDITELRQLEQVRSEFVANVSHELKTPLTSIKGFIETLKDGAINDDAAREKFLDIIDIEADRLTRLINDILSLSELEGKRQSITSDEINLENVLEEIEYIMHSLAVQKEIDLSFDIGDEELFVAGNFDKIKQLLINLVDNAIKYTPKGGSVKVNAYSKDNSVYIEVSDTGIGISKEHLTRLFERFYRVDKGRSRALGGTGLGLAIVKHIIAAMDGDISVESEPGRGSKFTVKLHKLH